MPDMPQTNVVDAEQGRFNALWRNVCQALRFIFPKTIDPYSHNVAEDVLLLSRYAVEVAKVPESVAVDEAYALCRKQKVESLDDEEFRKLVRLYKSLEDALAPVTSRTLRATHVETIRGYLVTSAGLYLTFLWILSIAIMLLAAVTSEEQILDEIIVFANPEEHSWSFFWNTLYLINHSVFEACLYGTLGSTVFLLRNTSNRIRERTFIIFEIPADVGRLILGTLAGGLVALFPELFSGSQEQLDVTNMGVTFSLSFVAFLAGYNVDFVFSILDRIVEKIKLVKQVNRSEVLLNRHKQKLENAKSDEEKRVLKGVVQDLEMMSSHPH